MANAGLIAIKDVSNVYEISTDKSYSCPGCNSMFSPTRADYWFTLAGSHALVCEDCANDSDATIKAIYDAYYG